MSIAIFMHNAVACGSHRDHLRPTLDMWLRRVGVQPSSSSGSEKDAGRRASTTENWKEWFDAVEHDTAVPERFQLLRGLVQTSHVYYLAPVPQNCKPALTAFLAKQGVHIDDLTVIYKPSHRNPQIDRDTARNALAKSAISVLEQEHRNLLLALLTGQGLSPFLKQRWPRAVVSTVNQPTMENLAHATINQAEEGAPTIPAAGAVGETSAGDVPASQLPDQADHCSQNQSDQSGLATGAGGAGCQGGESGQPGAAVPDADEPAA